MLGVPGPGALVPVPARPPSPAAGELPGAGQIGLLQHLLHSGHSGVSIAGHTAAAATTAAATATAFPGQAAAAASAGPLAALGRRASFGTMVIGAGPFTPATSGVTSGPGGGAGGGPAGLARRASAAHLPTGLTSPPGAAPAPTDAGGQHGLPSGQPPAPPHPVQHQLMVDAPSAPFAGLPASLQQRAQQQHHPQPAQWQAQLHALLHRPHGREAAPSGSADGPRLPQLSAGGAGGGSAFGLAGAGAPPQSNMGGFVGAPGGGGGGGGVVGSLAHQLTWPAVGGGASSALTAGAGGLMAMGDAGAGGFNLAYFAATTGSYEAAALAEATAEATAVAAADEVLEPMDED
ncbi:hypothetical protein GPECTOR_1682g804 [Gonium pectorale]|uniref:Uncharacterized protein n=1 Tax=Gonium pectorale TaxID=33097 RepID=A0A150FV18_GONPE|nr:hypothetical protein GPECTOR_1682g804 [Gonium pectorale]|eukprot:KXZ40870.1 hypothetical protein GPECTOR_1682g804 [Gonium pectorale]